MPIDLAEQTTTLRQERRKNHSLRARFGEAERLITPVLHQDPLQSNGTELYRAMRRLQAAFPDLNDMELEALVASVIRSLANRAK